MNIELSENHLSPLACSRCDHSCACSCHARTVAGRRHSCWLALPNTAADQDMTLCSCGVLYLYDKWDEDADGNLTPRWRRCDERGRLLFLRRTSAAWRFWDRTYEWSLP